jgi:hypothetical protein
MSKKYLNDIDLRGKLLINGSGGTVNYFLQTDGTGNITWAAASGGGSGFTGAGTSITDITGLSNTNVTWATSGTGTLTLGTGSGAMTISPGGALTVAPANSSTTSGRAVSLTGGASSRTGTVVTGGTVTITGGAVTGGTLTLGTSAGNVTIRGGSATAVADATGGNVSISGGQGGTSPAGDGTVSIGTSNTSGVSIGGANAPVTMSGAVTLNSTITLGNGVIASGAYGSSGQVLTSGGTGAALNWVNAGGYTALVGTPYTIAGTQPSFTSIPQTYKKLVVQIKFDNIGSLAGTFSMSVNSGSTVAYTAYSTGSTTSSTSNGSAAGLPLTTIATSPTTTNIYTVEIPNYTSPNPTMWLSGGVGLTTNASRWGVGTTTSAITQISFQATTNTWTGATGTATIYGVN